MFCIVVYVLCYFSLVVLIINKNVSKKFLSYFSQLKRKTFWRIILISVGRYFIFSTQFLILIHFFNPTLDLWLIAAGVGWIFFVRTSIPAFFGGLGLREASAFLFFQSLVTDTSTIIIPVFILWILNTAIPSILGSILIWKLIPQYSSDSPNYSA